MSREPGQELGPGSSLFFGLFYLSMLIIPIAIIVGASWLFRHFLVEVCDAVPSGPLSSPTTTQPESHNAGDVLGAITDEAPLARHDDVRTVIGMVLSLFSVLLLAATEVTSKSTDIGSWVWPLYWFTAFGPYYIVRYWGAPRRDGSSSRLVLILVGGAVAFGWIIHLGLWGA